MSQEGIVYAGQHKRLPEIGCGLEFGSQLPLWLYSADSVFERDLAMTAGDGSRVIDTIWRDFRYALRSLGKRRGFTILAVASLGIGLGANTALFSPIR